MGANPTQPRKRFGLYNKQDSDNNNMLIGHAYRANQDGFVIVKYVIVDQVHSIQLYVDTDSDPIAGGDIIAEDNCQAYSQTNDKHSLTTVPIAKGEYFIITGSNVTVTILWRGIGNLKKPTDFN